MSLPSEINLPLREDYTNAETLNEYFRDLIAELEDAYESIVDNVNGNISTNADLPPSQWIPVLNGSTPGTFTYTQQIGWAIRQGIYNHIYFDITWSATTAAGNLILELPYLVTTTDGLPFVGVCQPSDLTFTGGTGIVINAISATYTAEFWNIGDAYTTSNQQVISSGRIIGNLFYIGVTDE